jgi:hypothetical protein
VTHFRPLTRPLFQSRTLRAAAFVPCLTLLALGLAACSSDSGTGDSSELVRDAAGNGLTSEGSELGSVLESAASDPSEILLTADVPGSEPPDVVDGGASAPSLSDAGPGSVVEAPLPKGVTIVADPDSDGGVQILCGSAPCACSDEVDNDADGSSDGADAECTGPFDNDESTFSTGVPGDNRDPKWQDCFFDGNSGAGDDDCRYHTDCLTGELPKDDPSCVVSQTCKDMCQPLTPPGCDCFGCCQITAGDETLHVVVSDTCSMELIDDEQACPRCEPTDICNNECGRCEICLGQTIDDLPEDCFPPTTPPETGNGGGPNQGDDGDGGPPGSGGGGPNQGSGGGSSTGGNSGLGGEGNTPPPPSTSTPPGNTCDNGAVACVTSDDCTGSGYCSLGCCKTVFIVR